MRAILTAIVVAGWLMASSIGVLANAATPASKELVLVGKVTSLKLGSGDEVKGWIVTVTVEKVLTGDFSGRTFQFAVHSPAQSGLTKGRSCTVEAVWDGTGYTVDEHQWMKRKPTEVLGAVVTSSAVAAGADVSGIWRDARGRKPYSEIRTIDHGSGDVEFQLDLWGGPPANNGGGMEGRMSMKEGKAVFETKELGALCRIEFTFTSRRLIVRQAIGSPAECGFGNRIFADGTFVRMTRKAPRFIHR